MNHISHPQPSMGRVRTPSSCLRGVYLWWEPSYGTSHPLPPYLLWNSHHAKPLPHWGKFPEEPLLRMSMKLGGTSYVPAHTSKTFDDLTWIRPSAQKSCRVRNKLRHSRIRSYELLSEWIIHVNWVERRHNVHVNVRQTRHQIVQAL